MHNGKIIFSLLILAHFISDFAFQNDKVAKNKIKNWYFLVKHGLVVFLTSLILTFAFFSYKLSLIIIVITIFHTAIDLIKIKLEDKHLNTILLFVIDQLCHLIIIISFYPSLKTIKLNFLGDQANKLIIGLFPLFQTLSLAKEDWSIIILIISGYIFVWSAGAILVKEVLDTFDFSENNKNRTIGFISTEVVSSRNNIGKLIGQLERIVILTLVLCKSLGVISLVFAAKSIVRFNNFNKKDLADYYIVGTFASLLISLVIGLILIIIVSKYYSGNFMLHDIL